MIRDTLLLTEPLKYKTQLRIGYFKVFGFVSY